jgi:hypothetical protein
MGIAMAIGRRRFRGGNYNIGGHGSGWPLMLHFTLAKRGRLIVLRSKHSLA